MRYLLVVGFACDVFKQEPQAKIFVGDKFIDEFKISKHNDAMQNNSFYVGENALQPTSKKEFAQNLISRLPTLRFYEVDLDQSIDSIELEIHIENNDNNFTNGFMNASTFIKLQACYFFPLNQILLERYIKIVGKNIISKNYAWYRSQKNLLFDLLRNGIQAKKKLNDAIITTEDLASYSIGGNIKFVCNLKKKYGVLLNKCTKFNRFNLHMHMLLYFMNKYKKHANQGDSH